MPRTTASAYRARPARRGHPPGVARVAHVADLDHRDRHVGHVQGAEVVADIRGRCRRPCSSTGARRRGPARRAGLRQPQRGGRRCRSSTACAGSARSRGSRGPRRTPRRRAARPSAARPRARRTGRGRRRTDPSGRWLLVFRVIRTRARRAPRAAASTARERRKVTVASATPLLVAVPVVLHGFSEAAGGDERG